MDTELYLTSIHGQQYQCSYAEIGEERRKEKQDEKDAVETGISELLKPMQDGPCLIYVCTFFMSESIIRNFPCSICFF